MADAYDTLQVNPRASDEVIRAAHDALVAVHAGDADRLKEIEDAWAALSSKARRTKYDSERTDLKGKTIGNGKYRVLELIAEGGFGSTYKGEHVLLNEPVCIKHCEDISVAHDAILIQETKALWGLSHHALPVMHDLLRIDDGSMALVMQLKEGLTIEQVVEKAGKLDPETTAWITERILNALLYLHHHGIVHGDIKPQNALVDQGTHSVYLIDFGLSAVRPRYSTKSQGYTPHFAPPEQEQEHGGTLVPASDFFSLGVLMVYMLGGGMGPVERLQVPARIPTPMRDFIKRMISEKVTDRPQGDLFDMFREVRAKSFGRARSGMKPIPGL